MSDRTEQDSRLPETPESNKGSWRKEKWKAIKERISPEHHKESEKTSGDKLNQNKGPARAHSFSQGQEDNDRAHSPNDRPSTSDGSPKWSLVTRTKSRLINMNRSSSNASNSSKKGSKDSDSQKPAWGALVPVKKSRPLSLVQEEQTRQAQHVPLAVEEQDEPGPRRQSTKDRSHMIVNPFPNDPNPPLMNQELGEWEAHDSGHYLPGQIVWAWHNTQNRDKHAFGDLRRYTRTNLHRNWVYTKERPFVVLVRYSRQMLCLPLRSFEGAGLEKHENNKAIQSHYVAVKMAASTVPVFEGVNGPALELSGGETSVSSCISLKEAVTLTYDEEISVTQGHRLTPESTIRLLALWQIRMEEAMNKDARDIYTRFGLQKTVATAKQEFRRR